MKAEKCNNKMSTDDWIMNNHSKLQWTNDQKFNDNRTN